MKFKLKIWRHADTERRGKFVDYERNEVHAEDSFL